MAFDDNKLHHPYPTDQVLEGFPICSQLPRQSSWGKMTIFQIISKRGKIRPFLYPNGVKKHIFYPKLFTRKTKAIWDMFLPKYDQGLLGNFFLSKTYPK